jgi:hypothetical protein
LRGYVTQPKDAPGTEHLIEQVLRIATTTATASFAHRLAPALVSARFDRSGSFIRPQRSSSLAARYKSTHERTRTLGFTAL